MMYRRNKNAEVVVVLRPMCRRTHCSWRSAKFRNPLLTWRSAEYTKLAPDLVCSQWVFGENLELWTRLARATTRRHATPNPSNCTHPPKKGHHCQQTAPRRAHAPAKTVTSAARSAQMRLNVAVVRRIHTETTEMARPNAKKVTTSGMIELEQMTKKTMQ